MANFFSLYFSQLLHNTALNFSHLTSYLLDLIVKLLLEYHLHSTYVIRLHKTCSSKLIFNFMIIPAQIFLKILSALLKRNVIKHFKDYNSFIQLRIINSFKISAPVNFVAENNIKREKNFFLRL